MRSAKLANGALWALNVLLGGATIVAAFSYLIFPSVANPLADVEEDATVLDRPKPRQQENYAYLRNFQNPVEPRVAAVADPAQSDIKGVDLTGTVPSPAAPKEAMAYLAIPARNVFPLAAYEEPVMQDGASVPELAGWKLVAVTRDTATFSNGSKETVLRVKETAIGGSAGVGPVGGGPMAGPAALAPPGMTRDQLKITKIASANDSETYTIDKNSIAWANANQDMLLNEVGLQDYSSGGIQVVSMAPGSIAEQFGLRPNDVIRSVNGQPITNSLALADLRNSEVIKRASALTIGIERAGAVRALVIRSAR